MLYLLSLSSITSFSFFYVFILFYCIQGDLLSFWDRLRYAAHQIDSEGRTKVYFLHMSQSEAGWWSLLTGILQDMTFFLWCCHQHVVFMISKGGDGHPGCFVARPKNDTLYFHSHSNHMALILLQGHPGNVVFLCAQEEEMEWVSM